MKYFIPAATVFLLVLLSSCNKSVTSVTPPATFVPMWAQNGFPNKMVDTTLSAGMAHTIKSGPYTIMIPSNAFTNKVEFQLLTGDTAHFSSMTPMGQAPILAFAFQVRDLKTKQYLAKFNTSVTLTASGSMINPESKYYNISTSGTFSVNTKGMKNAPDTLMHPIAGDGVGWVITSPKVPDFSGLGFPDSLTSVNFTPGTADTIADSLFTVQIPSNAFNTKVRFVLLTGSPSMFMLNAPTGEKPVIAFAFKVVDLSTGQLIGKFNAPVKFKAMSSSITSQSKYYNISPNGMYADNPKRMSVQSGVLTHPIAGAPVGWVITSPN